MLATWLYSDIASTPTASPSLRMVSVLSPLPSARATAARSTPSRLSGARRSAAGLAEGVTRPSSPSSTLTNLHRKHTLLTM